MIPKALRIQNIANSIPGALLVYKINANGTDELLYISDQVEELWGVKKEDALADVGLLWAAILEEDLPAMQAAMFESAAKLSFWDQVYRIAIGDKIRWINGRGYPVKTDDGGVVWNTLILDVTEFKETQIKLSQLNVELENRVLERTKELVASNTELIEKQIALSKANTRLEEALLNLKEAELQLIRSEKMASLSVLTSGMAHELNNPLNYISAGISAIKSHMEESSGPVDFEVKKLFETIDLGINKLSGIVSNLGRFSASYDQNDVPCSIHTIIRNCLAILRNQYSSKIQLNLQFNQSDIRLTANESKLHQVFTNIILNAVQSVEENGAIEIKTWQADDQAHILVKDNGEGISEENLNKVFDPFFTTRDPGKGTGLGLSIAYAIVQEHSGTLTVTSTLKQGTEVLVTLPL